MKIKSHLKLDVVIISSTIALTSISFALSDMFFAEKRPTYFELAGKLCNMKGFIEPSVITNDEKLIKILCQ